MKLNLYSKIRFSRFKYSQNCIEILIANVRCLITFALEKLIPALVEAGYENDAHLHLYHTGQQKHLPVNSISFETWPQNSLE